MASACRSIWVYNPLGVTLPPNQQKLEQDYKRELAQHFGITFSQLYVLANMPIQRFGSMLISKGTFAGYMTLLKDNFKPENMEGLMCRSMVSVDYQGYLYDCDFNQMLELPLAAARTIFELESLALGGQPIATGSHCFGCTAGSGSSCGGSLT